MSPRLVPVEPPYEPEVAAELARWMPPGAPLDPLLLFRTLVADLPLAQAMLPLGRFLLGRRCAIDRRLRELVIDRISARAGCEYEWGVHVTAFAAAAGLGDDAVHATVHGAADDPAFAPDDALVVALVDELCAGARVSDALWARLAARFTPAQCLELLVLAGWYHVIAFVANGARVALEPWAARFPPA